MLLFSFWMTRVCVASKMADAGLWLKSMETRGASFMARALANCVSFFTACFIVSLSSEASTILFVSKVKSTTETLMVGTRMA